MRDLSTGWADQSAANAVFFEARVVEVNGSLARIEAEGQVRAQYCPTLAPYLPTLDDQVLVANTPSGAVILGAINRTEEVSGTTAVYAPLDSPAFTGSPTAPLAPADDDSDRIATTEFVNDWAQAIVHGIEFTDGYITFPYARMVPGSGGTFTTFPADGAALTAKAALQVKIYFGGTLYTAKIPIYNT